jgi:hypothetical protein
MIVISEKRSICHATGNQRRAIEHVSMIDLPSLPSFRISLDQVGTNVASIEDKLGRTLERMDAAPNLPHAPA